jgi:hypothetical protein
MLTRCALFALALVPLTLANPTVAYAQDELRFELNTAEAAQSRCRMSFLVENKADRPVESLKLDLVIFGTENTMQRRMVIEIGPVRKTKTMMRTYEVDRECAQIGAILVNDIAACAPGDPGSCMDQLQLSSRVGSIRLYK